MLTSKIKKQSPTSIRLPARIRDLIDASAMENQRSRNLEIVMRLAKSLGLKGTYGAKMRKKPQKKIADKQTFSYFYFIQFLL